MPRDGSGVYSKAAVTVPASGQSIVSADYNSTVDDFVLDANTARPVVAGGTGATSASGARTNFAVPGRAETETISGTWTFTGGPAVTTADMTVADSIRLTFGAGTDGDIYSDGTDLHIEVRDGSTLRLKNSNGENLARFYTNAGFDLPFNNSTVLSGISGGIRVTGDIDGDTVSGDMVASNSEALTGTATDHLVTPANVSHVISNKVGTTDIYASTGNSYTNGTRITLAHGLSSVPSMFSLVALCGTADAGFSAGDKVVPPSFWNSSSNYYGTSISADATNIYIDIGVTGIRVHTSAGALGAIWTPANWTLEVRAWAF